MKICTVNSCRLCESSAHSLAVNSDN